MLPNRNYYYFTKVGEKKTFFLPSQWKHNSANQKLASPEAFHFSVVRDFFVPPFFLQVFHFIQS